jgi:hypothetical protein
MKHIAFAVLVAAGLFGQGDTNSPIGVWRGESLCTSSKPSACKNEKVVYYIEAAANRSDQVMIRADKIVDGQAVTMGEGPWDYDAAKHTLGMGPDGRRWLLKIAGKRIDGTLTMSDGEIFRKMTLTKD